MPVQRHPRGDPHRPPGPLPRHARRERQPGALAGRQRTHARGARRARPARRHRRRHDRDRAPRATTCCRRRRSSRSGRRRSSTSSSRRNVFHLRRPLLDRARARCPSRRSTPGSCEALGARRPTTTSRRCGRPPSRDGPQFAEAFFAATAANPTLGALAPVVLYRTLGPTLPDGAASAAVLWGAAHRCAHVLSPTSVRRAGFDGEGLSSGEAAVRRHRWPARRASCSRSTSTRTAGGGCAPPTAASTSPSPSCSTSSATLRRAAGRRDPEYPFVLSAGERRSFTANTIFRDPTWRKRDPGGALRVDPADAAPARRRRRRAGPAHDEAGDGGGRWSSVGDSCSRATSRCPTGSASTTRPTTGLVAAGVAPNELTAIEDRDRLAGTPWHKHVPARLEAVG